MSPDMCRVFVRYAKTRFISLLAFGNLNSFLIGNCVLTFDTRVIFDEGTDEWLYCHASVRFQYIQAYIRCHVFVIVRHVT